jgi:thymidylate synthase (FAD)
MPENSQIKPSEPLYCKTKWYEKGSITYVNQLEYMNVTIYSAPSEEELKNTLAAFMLNSWAEKSRLYGFSEEEIDTCIKELTAGRILPIGLETINFVFCIEGLDLIDATHLLRHRMFTFSAQCSDRDLRDTTFLVKPAIMEDDGFYERYMEICRLSHSLYKDMMDSEDICTLDARTVLPLSRSYHYSVRCCLKDLILFCNQRLDEQIQPQSDNILALKLWLEVAKLYPFLKNIVDIRQQSTYYINQCKSGKTTMFPPNDRNDVFDWSPDQFLHDKHRDNFLGGESYISIRDKLIAELDSL